MKIGKSKILTFGILMTVCFCSAFLAARAAEFGSTDDYYKVTRMDVGEYRKDAENLVAPTCPGYLFAGWFADEGCKTAIGKDITVGLAYAKFVPEDILGLKAQVNQELIDDDTNNDATGAIRFVTSVDSLQYSEVGFVFQRMERTEKKSSNQVYGQLYAVDTDAVMTEYRPYEVFHPASRYFKTWTYTNVPDSAYGTEITATPFWVTLDGTTVKGKTEVKCVNDGRQWKYIFVADAGGSDEAGTGTRDQPYATLNAALAHIQTYGESRGGEVWVLGSLTAGSDFKWEKHGLDVTITGDKSADTDPCTVDFSGVKDMQIRDGITFAHMTLKLQGSSLTSSGRVFAVGNRLKIAADVTSDNPYTTIHGGGFMGEDVDETNVTILAGKYRAVYGGGLVANVRGDTHVTIKNTDIFNTTNKNDSRVHGGGGRKGIVGGNAYVLIGEGFNKNASYTNSAHHRYSSVWGGGSASLEGAEQTSVVAGDTYVTIEGDAKIDWVYGGGYNNSEVQGTCHVTFKGGSVIGIYGGGSGSQSEGWQAVNSHTSVVMTGGQTTQIVGGNEYNNMTGNTSVQVLGGTVTRRIIGGCYNVWDWGWDSDCSVAGNVNVTIGPEAVLDIKSDTDNSICAVSRYESNFTDETGIMVVNAGQDTSKLGLKAAMNIYNADSLYANYLIEAGQGGMVTSENGALRIAPDTQSGYLYATVTDVTDKEEVLYRMQGEGICQLPPLTDRRTLQKIKVIFSKEEPDRFTTVARTVLNGSVFCYDSLEKAVAAANTSKDTEQAVVYVSGEVEVGSTMTVSKNISIRNDSGKDAMIKRSRDVLMFSVAAGGTLMLGTNDQEERGSLVLDDEEKTTTTRIVDNRGNFILGRNATVQNVRNNQWGSVLVNRSTAELYGSIRDTVCTGAGGAVLQYGGKLIVYEGIYTNNQAIRKKSGTNTAGYGGFIRMEAGETELRGGTFTDNSATGFGGVMYVKENSAAVISGGTFSNNKAESGAAIYAAGTVTIVDGIFEGEEHQVFRVGN